MVEILELPGIFPDARRPRRRSWPGSRPRRRSSIRRPTRSCSAMALYPDQAFFSKRAVRKPADFKGLKMRVHSVALASLVAGARAASRSPSRSPRPTPRWSAAPSTRGSPAPSPGSACAGTRCPSTWSARSRCGRTSPSSINKNSWKRLPPDIQQILKEEAEQVVEGKAFEAIEAWNKEGIDKSVEKGMEHIPFSPETQAAIKDVAPHEGRSRLGEARGRGRGGEAVQRGRSRRWSASPSSREARSR